MIHHVEVQVLVLLLVAAFVGMGARRFRLPYTLALVVAGLGLGFADLQVLHGVELNAELLLLLLLPALLFEAAFHIDFREFKQNLIPIITLALPGVMIVGALTTLLLYYGLGSTGMVEGFGWRESLIFASVIAATDPVSVLALFRTLGVPRRLYLLVEGESLLNDGIAVVLFVIITTVFGVSPSGLEMEAGTSLAAFGTETFLRMGGGGVLIGVLLGAAFSLLTRTIDDHLIETTLTALLAYGSFLIAETFHCSGVLATVFAGIVAGSYGAKVGMSHSTKNAVVDFWEFAAFLANSFVFLLVGLELEPSSLLEMAVPILAAFAITVLARAIAIHSAVPLVNRIAEPIALAWRHVLVWGGLRGSLSMVLVLSLPASFAGRQMLVTIVFGVVGLSLFVQGLTMGGLMGRLGLLVGDGGDKAFELARATKLMTQHALDELDELEHVGLVSAPVATRLREAYHARRTAAEAQVAEHTQGAEANQQLVVALRRLAHAERAALRHAADAELVGGEAAEELARGLMHREAELGELDVHDEAAVELAVRELAGESVEAPVDAAPTASPEA